MKGGWLARGAAASGAAAVVVADPYPTHPKHSRHDAQKEGKLRNLVLYHAATMQ